MFAFGDKVHDGNNQASDVRHLTVSIARPPSVVYAFASNPANVAPAWPSGVTIHNPMRVMANGEGSEVVFSLFHLPGVSDAKFAEDATWVMKDLETLKRVLES